MRVLVLHLAFIAFALLGGLLVVRWPRLAWLHLPAAAWAAGIAFFGGICPLTPLENRLRAAGGEAVYDGGFIERQLEALIYPDWLTREIQIALGAIVLGVNLFAYARLLKETEGDAPPSLAKSERPLLKFLRRDDDAAGAAVHAERGAERDDGQELRARQPGREHLAHRGRAFGHVGVRDADPPAARGIEPAAQQLAVAPVRVLPPEQHAAEAEAAARLAP